MDKLKMQSKNILGCGAPFCDAQTAVFGAPFDGTSSFRPGSRFAPAAIRAESYGMETYSPYQDADLCGLAVCDMGDVDLPFGHAQAALDMIEATAQHVLESGKKMLMLGGEHLVSLPAIQAALVHYPGLCVVHLDAHADLREDYTGERLSHSTVMRRVWDSLGDGRIWQFGIRSGIQEEFAFARAGHTFFHPFGLQGVDKAVAALKGKPVYLTIDLDVLDPGVFPGTGTPEAGGVSFRELIGALCAMKKLHIIGADLVELAPHYDPSGCSTALACTLLRETAILLSDN